MAEPRRQCAVGTLRDVVFCKDRPQRTLKVHERKEIPATVAYRNLSVTWGFQ